MEKTEDLKTKDYKNMIEALLFASGRYMNIDTLLNLTKASDKKILINNINKLKEEYEARKSPLMIVEEKDGWKITVKETYLSLVRKIVSETELPKTILETLAVIAWKNPVLQSSIIDIRHNKAYDHITELEELGFIKKEKKGRSFILKLTDKFYDYFDVDGAKNIREVFARVVGKQEEKAKQELAQQVSEAVTPEQIVRQEEKKDSEKENKEEHSIPRDKTKEQEEFSELE